MIGPGEPGMIHKEERPDSTPFPPTGADDSSVAAAWTEFLETHAWSYYITLTFRAPPSAQNAHRKFRRWLHRINRQRFGHNYYRYHSGVPWARSSEQQSRGALHYHALIGACPNLDVEAATADWKKLAGIARIRRYVPGGGAAGYLAKVYSRDGRGEIDVGGDWTKLRRR